MELNRIRDLSVQEKTEYKLWYDRVSVKAQQRIDCGKRQIRPNQEVTLNGRNWLFVDCHADSSGPIATLVSYDLDETINCRASQL